MFRGKTVAIAPVSVDAGRASALGFARAGANVFVVDSSTEVVNTLVEELKALGARAHGFVADLTDKGSLDAAAEFCAAWQPSVHALVACHLQAEAVSLEDSTEASWRQAVEVNLFGPVFTTLAFLPLLKTAQGAAIVYVSSFDGILGNAHFPLVSTVKGAIAPLTHVAGNEFAAHGIRVNTVARGMTSRPEQDANPRFKHLIADTPLARPARPEEIAAAVRFLASPDASYITGTVLVVDGGRTGITPGTRRMDVTGDSPMWSAPQSQTE